MERVNVADITNSSDKLFASVQCRIIHIGSYKFEPNEKVIFSSKGIRIVAPSVKEPTENVILDIQIKEIIKVCSNFSKGSSVIFIYVLPSCSTYVRQSLDMPSTSKGGREYILL